MTGLNTSLGDLARFQVGQQVGMFRALGGRDGGLAETRAFGAILAASPFLSHAEQKALLTAARAFAADGDIGHREAATLSQMSRAFASDGERGLRPLWPFPDLNFDRAPGSRLFTAMLGVIGEGFGNVFGDTVGDAVGDYVFMGTAQNLLENSGGNNKWMGRLAGALADADLARLSPPERGRFLASLTMASLDGRMTRTECASLMRDLARMTAAPFRPPVDVQPTPAPQPWSATTRPDGTATIDLGNYTLQLNEHNSEMLLTNKATGESSKVWGDPHFDTDNDGKTDVDFWGTMTLNLDDGTSITLNTTPFGANHDVTLTSQLVITKGEQSMVVDGLDQNSIGDLTVTQGMDGHRLDSLYGNGLNVYEKQGGGWQVRDGLWMRDLDQSDGDSTRGQPGTEYNAGGERDARHDLIGSLWQYAAFLSVSWLMGSMLDHHLDV